MRPILALAAALIASPLLSAGPASADEPPIATAAPATAAGPPAMSVADQIDAYLKSSPVLEVDRPGAVDGVVLDAPTDDRRVHGEVSVGVGTGGYRSVYARTDMPLGESGRLSLAFGDTRYGRGWGQGPGRFDGYGANRGFGSGRDDCLADEPMTSRRFDPAAEDCVPVRRRR